MLRDFLVNVSRSGVAFSIGVLIGREVFPVPDPLAVLIAGLFTFAIVEAVGIAVGRVATSLYGHFRGEPE